MVEPRHRIALHFTGIVVEALRGPATPTSVTGSPNDYRILGRIWSAQQNVRAGAVLLLSRLTLQDVPGAGEKTRTRDDDRVRPATTPDTPTRLFAWTGLKLSSSTAPAAWTGASIMSLSSLAATISDRVATIELAAAEAAAARRAQTNTAKRPPPPTPDSVLQAVDVIVNACAELIAKVQDSQAYIVKHALGVRLGSCYSNVNRPGLTRKGDTLV